MRLQHFKTISFLPSAQLIGQWYDCYAIAQNWANDELLIEKTPAISKLLYYGPEDFIVYCSLVEKEMKKNGFVIREYNLAILKDNFFKIFYGNKEHCRLIIDELWNNSEKLIEENDIFKGWHNEEYLSICYHLMLDKYLNGCIPDEEWNIYLEGGRNLV